MQLIELNSAEWHCLVHKEIENFQITWIKQQNIRKMRNIRDRIYSKPSEQMCLVKFFSVKEVLLAI